MSAAATVTWAAAGNAIRPRDELQKAVETFRRLKAKNHIWLDAIGLLNKTQEKPASTSVRSGPVAGFRAT